MIKWFDIEKLLLLTPEEYSVCMGKAAKWGIIFTIVLLVCFLSALIFFKEHRETMFYIVQAFFSAVAIFSLIALFIQSCITRKHKQTSITLQKSYKTIELIYEWSKDSSTEMLLARKIVDKMQLEEVKKLAEGNAPISISVKDYEMLCGFLPDRINGRSNSEKTNKNEHETSPSPEDTKTACQYIDNCVAANSHTLSMAETLWLRAWVVKYLNILEIIMYAWKANLADRDLVEKEFAYLVKSERDGSVVLKSFRDKLGQENYPGIYSFCEYLSDKNKKEILELSYGG